MTKGIDPIEGSAGPTPTEALWTATERLRALEDAAPVGIIALDLQGRVTIWNRAADRLFGWRADEVIGREFLPLHDDQPGEYVALIARALQGETLARIETCRLTKDGDPVTVCLSSAPIWNEAGALSGTVIALNDLTALKRVEEQFLQAQKMEVVGQLACGIAHDFNNILTAILGFGDLVRERLLDQPDAAADVEEICRAGERASQLTRQLLVFSRKQLWARRVLDLNQIVHAFAKMLTRMISEDIRLDLVAEGALDGILADPAQIEQLLMNLIVNARDAMPQGGTLTVTTGNALLDAAFVGRHPTAIAGRYVFLTVKDTGCGMSPDVMSRIFEPFFTTKGPGKGTGLGMATVFGIVQQCGGYITVESALGRGTSVTIYLPTTDPVEMVVVPALPVPPLGGTETILLAEDEAGVRTLLRRVLEKYGYTVLVARSGEDALAVDAAHAGPIDLLISDLIMPGLNGAELAQRLLVRRPSLKVLLVSGYTSEQDIGMVSNPNVGFLQKPFRAEMLARRVRERLENAHVPPVSM